MSYGSAAEAWNSLAVPYEKDRTRPDSLDRLVEFPTQLDMIGDVTGLRILDLGCGSGAKAIHLARSGAADVVGVDVSDTFIRSLQGADTPRNTSFVKGDLNDLDQIEELEERTFDLALCLQSFGYVADPVGTLCRINGLLADDGVLVLSRPHPMRFAVERAEAHKLSLGEAYHSRHSHSYSSEWAKDTLVTDRTDTFSDMVNSLSRAGFRITDVAEPQLSDAQKAEFPDRKKWMDQYFGIIVFRAEVDRRGSTM